MLRQLASLKNTKKFAQNSFVVRVYHPKSSKNKNKDIGVKMKLEFA